MPASSKYTDEEVRKILDRALRSGPDSGMTHDELVAVASEVGVSREAIDAAARHVQLEGKSTRDRQGVLRRRRRGLVWHAATFTIVNAFLFAINYLTSPGQWWVAFPIFGWGLALVFHALFALSRKVSPKAILEEQRRTGHNALPELELARLSKSTHSTSAAAPRTRVDAASATSPSDSEAEHAAEQDVSAPEVRRNRE